MCRSALVVKMVHSLKSFDNKLSNKWHLFGVIIKLHRVIDGHKSYEKEYNVIGLIGKLFFRHFNLESTRYIYWYSMTKNCID